MGWGDEDTIAAAEKLRAEHVVGDQVDAAFRSLQEDARNGSPTEKISAAIMLAAWPTLMKIRDQVKAGDMPDPALVAGIIFGASTALADVLCAVPVRLAPTTIKLIKTRVDEAIGEAVTMHIHSALGARILADGKDPVT